MQKRSTTLLVVFAAIILLGLWAMSVYNGMVSSKGNVDAKWAQVETQYQRRFDLVPNLVNTVKGAANFEQSTLTAVTEARTRWMNAGNAGAAVTTSERASRVAAADQFESALSRLLVTVEAYPLLQATQAYRDLMTQLEGTENRIATSRKDFNEAVQSYNVQVRQFPRNILAGIFGFTPEQSFSSTPGAETAPTVNFETSAVSS